MLEGIFSFELQIHIPWVNERDINTSRYGGNRIWVELIYRALSVASSCIPSWRYLMAAALLGLRRRYQISLDFFLSRTRRVTNTFLLPVVPSLTIDTGAFSIRTFPRLALMPIQSLNMCLLLHVGALERVIWIFGHITRVLFHTSRFWLD